MAPEDDPHRPPHVVLCPRCGYDQRGTVAAWTNSCPLDGACTECGLGFQWAELLSVKLQRPRWCIEYASSIRDWIRRVVANTGMVFAPMAMWRSLRMTHPPRIRRLVLVPLALLMVLLPIVYTTVRINVVADRYFMMSRSWNVTMNVSLLKACAQSVFMPWSRISPGTYTDNSPPTFGNPPAPPAIMPFPPPASIPTLFALSRYKSIGNLWWRQGHGSESRLVIGPMVFILAMILVFPLGFLVLPVTRKKAKVRWVHVIRVMLYSLAWFMPSLVLMIVIMIAEPMSQTWTSTMTFWITVLAYLGTPVFLVIFWQSAVSRYLRMPHSRGIAIGVGAMVLLFTSAVLFYAANPLTPAEFLEMSGKAIWGSNFHRDH